jgi:hypothetical protein
MEIEYSEHWKRKQVFRTTITQSEIEFALLNAPALRDKHWDNALNAIFRIPPSGRILKVVYRKIGISHYRIITAFWLD